MVSDKPRQDRCGEPVYEWSGITVTDGVSVSTYSTEEDLQEVVLERDRGDTEESDSADRITCTTYDEIQRQVDNGYVVSSVVCSTEDTSNPTAIAIEDDDPSVSYVSRDRTGYCERYPMETGVCYVHNAETEQYNVGNQYAVTHGLHAKRSNYYNELDVGERAVIQQLAHSWIENAPFDDTNFAKVSEIYRIAIDQYRLWKSHDVLSEGITEEVPVKDEDGNVVYDENGDPLTTKEENAANLPYDRLDRTTYRKLKDMGCLDDPESQQSDAVESLAEKFASLSEQ